MSVELREVSFPPLRELSVAAPDGAAIGIIGEDGAGKHALLRLAVGLETPASGQVIAAEPKRLLGPADALDFARSGALDGAPVKTLALHHALAQHDALVRARAAAALERLRRSGTTILLVSHEEELLRAWGDELWWLHQGRLAARGNPAEVLEKYRRHIAERQRTAGGASPLLVAPALRRGDGRAQVTNLEILGTDGRPTMVLSSGEKVSVRVTVRFERAVDDPVVGIMIRTRIGMEVYGTNTVLESVPLGPCRAGETLRVTFAFACHLCPQEYTLTAASHDPDGVWHDWLDDAVVFSVADTRYTAGAANLRARVTCERL